MTCIVGIVDNGKVWIVDNGKVWIVWMGGKEISTVGSWKINTFPWYERIYYWIKERFFPKYCAEFRWRRLK